MAASPAQAWALGETVPARLLHSGSVQRGQCATGQADLSFAAAMESAFFLPGHWGCAAQEPVTVGWLMSAALETLAREKLVLLGFSYAAMPAWRSVKHLALRYEAVLRPAHPAIADCAQLSAWGFAAGYGSLFRCPAPAGGRLDAPPASSIHSPSSSVCVHLPPIPISCSKLLFLHGQLPHWPL